MSKKVTLLIVDDDPQILTALRIVLVPEGYQLTCCRSPAEAVECLAQGFFDLALIDMNYQQDTTSGQEGLQLIERLQALDEQLPIIAMTGFGSIGLAVEAMKCGAADFIEKPWDNERLLVMLRQHIALQQQKKQTLLLQAQNELLQQQLTARPSHLVAGSAAMQQLMQQLERIAQSDMHVLLTGENGTGKSMLAEYLHQCSARQHRAFVAVNMGAVSENLFESEMFGHVKGAFTDAKTARIGRFELAEGGTLFLDEIANIPLTQQAKLLRVLEERQYEKLGSSHSSQADVRIVSATNADLSQLVQQGAFRQDLWYRLNTVTLHVPALRQRASDIVPLAEYFLRQHAEKYRLPRPKLSPAAMKALQEYSWPGNIRELSHVTERTLFLAARPYIDAADLNLPALSSAAASLQDATLADIEKQVLEQRMQRYQHNPTETAASLGLSRSAYYRRLEKFGL